MTLIVYEVWVSVQAKEITEISHFLFRKRQHRLPDLLYSSPTMGLL